MTTAELPLHARLKAAVAWRPVAGDVLTGHMITVEGRTTEYGTYPALYMEMDDATLVVVHAFHTVLKEELKRVKPTPGSYLEIAYLGQQDSAKRKDAGGKPVRTHLYSVSDGTNIEKFNSWDDFTNDTPEF